MALIVNNDENQETKINNDSTNVNKKYIANADNAGDDKESNVNVHNTIHDKYVMFVKNNKTMNDDYFRNTLMCIYSDVYKKGLIFKNIPDDVEIQNNIKKIQSDVSYSRAYEILKYYANDSGKELLNTKNLLEVTALFYSSLYLFIKRSFT